MMQGKVRIIGGKWRGRKLKVIDHTTLRPTSDRIRETLFNWLSPRIVNSCCLDLFAGSGALGIEAISRGAQLAWLIEKEYRIVQHLKQEVDLLDRDKFAIIQADAFHFLKKTPTMFDIVFLDPPFRQNLLLPCCEQLENQGWLAPNALIYLESEPHFDSTKLPSTWQIIRQQTAGQVIFFLVQRNGNF